jgi:predicted PurR-regulated permease PerM
LRDDVKLKSWFQSAFPELLEEHDDLFKRYCRLVDKDLEKIFFGNLLSILFFAVIAVATFLLLNAFVPPFLRIPYPIMLGVLCGVAALVPIVAMWAVLIPLYIYLTAQVLISGSSVGFVCTRACSCSHIFSVPWCSAYRGCSWGP